MRNLLVAAVVGLGLWASAAAGFWSGAVQPPLGTGGLRLIVAPAGLSIGVTCLAMALWMIWSSRVGKVRAGDRLLDTLRWTGEEQVRDVGCGRAALALRTVGALARSAKAAGLVLLTGACRMNDVTRMMSRA